MTRRRTAQRSDDASPTSTALGANSETPYPGVDPLTESLEDALGRRLLDALEDLWAHADRDVLEPATVLTL